MARISLFIPLWGDTPSVKDVSLDVAGILVEPPSIPPSTSKSWLSRNRGKTIHIDRDAVLLEVENNTVCRSIYRRDEKDKPLKIILSGNEYDMEAASAKIEQILNHVLSRSREDSPIKILLQGMQEVRLVEDFDVPSFLAFARATVRSGTNGEIDYLSICRRSWRGENGLEMRPKEARQSKFGFWLSSPQSQANESGLKRDPRSVRRTVDPYGGLM